MNFNMEELNEKMDKILVILEQITRDLKETKQNASKMSRHIDTVDEYVQIFDTKFRRRLMPCDMKSIENILD